jgi:hypothetical protein
MRPASPRPQRVRGAFRVRPPQTPSPLTGLVTKQKCDLLHQPLAEQPQHLDEREPTNHDSQQQGDTLLSHRGSLTLNHDHFRKS